MWRAGFVATWGLFASASALHAQTFFEVVLGVDYRSLGTAMTMAVIWSVIRTMLTLFSPNPVRQVRRELVGDQIVALFAGGLAYLLIEMTIAQGWFDLKPITRVVLVGVAGASRFSFFGWFANGVKNASDGLLDRADKALKAAKP